MAAMQNNLAQLTTTVQQMGQTEENVIAPLRDRNAKLEEALLQREASRSRSCREYSQTMCFWH